MARGNSFEGGTDEANITTGNSGGASGDAFDSVSIGTGATVVYDNAQAAHGSNSARIATTGTSSLAYVAYTLASVTSDISRAYIRLTSLPAVVQILTRYMSGANQGLRVNVKAAGTLEVRDAGNTVVGTTTSAVTPGQFWRYELQPGFGAGAGTCVLRLYTDPDSDTITDSLNLSGLTLTANATEVRFGVGAAAANMAAVWFDDLAVEGATWHGPAVRSITPTGISVAATPGSTALSQSFGVTPTGIAVPASLGSPTIAHALTVVPDGLAVPLNLGATALAQPMGVTPSGVSVPTALGDPATAQQMAVVPAGIAVPVALGAAGVATTGGTITRPNTGTVSRPAAGVITRPDTGVITRP